MCAIRQVGHNTYTLRRYWINLSLVFKTAKDRSDPSSSNETQLKASFPGLNLCFSSGSFFQDLEVSENTSTMMPVQQGFACLVFNHELHVVWVDER